tara:strand:+ start:1235 stop:1375 length:141 start_codon:yes stop_codon:yes gene_type:complete
MPRKISPINFDAVKGKTKRKGVHAKTKTSKHKASANYKKAYKGQGR